MYFNGEMCLKSIVLYLVALLAFTLHSEDKKPNILLAIADDWGWPHAGAYGDSGVKTPVFDLVAKDGILFTHAFVSSPSCTPSRGALLSGQHHWRLKEGANLWGTINKDINLYTDILSENGYFVGHCRKGWGPGSYKAGGRVSPPAGKKYENFKDFLSKRKKGQPFCFWFGSNDPHRPYELDNGANKGIDISKIKLYSSLPDHPTVRKDVADYYWEVQRFDREVGNIISHLTEIGEYENTIIVITGDHGMPFPRCKGNLYDSGTRVPLAISWGANINGNRKVNDFVSLVDLAPTFLEAAGIQTPEYMSGKSLLKIFKSSKEGVVDKNRGFVVFGRERHTLAQKFPSQEGYPSRGIRTKDYLLIKNYKPDLWPAGVPTDSTRGIDFSDCDYSPTKKFILKNRDDSNVQKYYSLSFAKRPKFELYDLRKDPDQTRNLAYDDSYEEIRKNLYKKLKAVLQESADPRVVSKETKFKDFKYYGRKRKTSKK